MFVVLFVLIAGGALAIYFSYYSNWGALAVAALFATYIMQHVAYDYPSLSSWRATQWIVVIALLVAGVLGIIFQPSHHTPRWKWMIRLAFASAFVAAYALPLPGFFTGRIHVPNVDPSTIVAGVVLVVAVTAIVLLVLRALKVRNNGQSERLTTDTDPNLVAVTTPAPVTPASPRHTRGGRPAHRTPPAATNF
jgi:hypothetical protein